MHDDDDDLDATVNVDPEAHRRILAEAFPADDEPTVRMHAPFVAAGVPSPLGDDEPSETTVTRTSPALGSPTTIRMMAVGVVAATSAIAAFVAMHG
jgi:hypothetical protein